MTSPFRRLSLAFYIALRMVRSRRSSTLSMVTLISVIGIMMGVFALTVVLAVTAGFEVEFRDRILGLYPHLVITAETSSFPDYEPIIAEIRATEGVVGATPLTHNQMRGASGAYSAGMSIQGVELESIGSVLNLKGLMKQGTLTDLSETPTATLDGTTVTVSPLTQQTWTTVVLDDDGVRVLKDTRATPDAGKSRVKLLDLRPASKRAAFTLTAVDGRAATVHEAGYVARIEGHPDIGKTRYGPAIEVYEGDWKGSDGRRIVIKAETLVTLVLLAEPDEDGVASRLIVEPADVDPVPSAAQIRVIDVRRSGPERIVQIKPPVTASTNGAGGGAEPAPAMTFEPVSPGDFTAFRTVPAQLPGMLLGIALAEKLHVELGSIITVVTPIRGIGGKMVGPVGMLPSSTQFRTVGIFEAGFYEHDANLAIIHIDVNQRFLNRGRVIQSIAVKTEDLFQISATKDRVSRAIDPFGFERLLEHTHSLDTGISRLTQPGFSDSRQRPPAGFVDTVLNVTEVVRLLKFQSNDLSRPRRFRVFDWKEKNGNLFSALQLQKVVLTMFFLIIIVVASFVVVGSQIMVVHEKSSDIAILKAMGATSGMVRLVFTLQGLFVALVGAALGLGLGLGFIWLIDVVDYKLEASIYFIDHLPAVVEPGALVLVMMGALLCTLLTTQISAGRAARKTPVEGLRSLD
ncbi:MAG: ABC-type lipoprotein release transport system permease subunit [Myxococcota bacterium]